MEGEVVYSSAVVVFLALFSYFIADTFTDLFDMASDAMLICVVEDKEKNPNSMIGQCKNGSTAAFRTTCTHTDGGPLTRTKSPPTPFRVTFEEGRPLCRYAGRRLRNILALC